jgi:DNA mismatch repair protein MutL
MNSASSIFFPMSKIRVLPDQLANQIAAGEVVERPASIVKELLENSLDAGATQIRVDIESGGRRLIKISDDGEGMIRDDAILAFERHATSKIKTAEDLGAIVTLGFRGEALASIASVSKVKLLTQTKDDVVGAQVEINGGKLLNVKEVAFTRGTEFEIRSLFFNVPARLKFLKSEATESFHIANLVTHYALANPKIAFTLTNNGRESISASPVETLRERAYQLFGGDFVDALIEVFGEVGSIRVSGFVSSPSVVRSTRDSQYFFVNGRFVRDKVLSRALTEAFRAMMPAGVYPSAMLFLELPPDEVDVNVHPAKTEVRFVRSTIVHDTVRDAIRASIGGAKAAVTPMVHLEPASLTIPKVHERPDFIGQQSSPSIGAYQPPQLSREEMLAGLNAPMQFTEESSQFAEIPKRETSVPAPPLEQQRINLTETEIIAEPSADDKPIRYGVRIGCLGTKGSDFSHSPLKPANDLSLIPDDIKPLGQMHNSFIIAVDRVGFMLIDQHVAHERILFEQHWQNLNRKQIQSQRLLMPETIDLTPAQASAFDQLSSEFEANGFEIGQLSGRTIAVKSIPAAIPQEAAKALLISLLEAIEQERRGLTMDEIRAEIAAGLACRAAIKINMNLTPEKMRWLIDELLKCNNPATCPHGRPIILRMTAKEIDKAFQRI